MLVPSLLFSPCVQGSFLLSQKEMSFSYLRWSKAPFLLVLVTRTEFREARIQTKFEFVGKIAPRFLTGIAMFVENGIDFADIIVKELEDGFSVRRKPLSLTYFNLGDLLQEGLCV